MAEAADTAICRAAPAYSLISVWEEDWEEPLREVPPVAVWRYESHHMDEQSNVWQLR